MTLSPEPLLIDDQHLESLSAKTGGLVFARYSFPASNVEQAQKMAVQIASGQTIGYVPQPIESYLLHMGRVHRFGLSDTGHGHCDIA